MNFEELKNYLEEEACNIEEKGNGFYLAKNTILGEICYIQELDYYSPTTLSHYFRELNVSIPEELEDFVHVYDLFRKDLEKVSIEKG